MRYWKIGSRWHEHGDKNSSILDVFLTNSIVFVKEENTRGRMMRSVKVGDIIAIGDGQTIVASAEVVAGPNYLAKFPLNLTPAQAKIFDYNYEKDVTIAVLIEIRKKNLNIFYPGPGAFCEILDFSIQTQL